MITFRRLTTIAAAAAVITAAPAFAGSNHGGVGGPPGPELLPPNAMPGQCFSRRVTGPGGAYRWDRIECDNAYGGGYGHGYGGGRLDVQTQGAPGYGYGDQGGYANDCDRCGGYGGGYAYAGDRYSERRYDARSSQSQYEDESSSYGDGYAYGRGGQGVNYPPPYGYDYVAAGRDEAGYLIWPGKTP
jgi:hypothetical protein